MLTYTLDKQAGLSLYEQLYRRVKADILSGRLAAGEKLPSKRALAAHLEVSVITVKNAYEQLMAEGYPRQVAQWCASHGLSSIGHPPGNYCTNPTDMHGDILKFYRHTQIPLTDYIFYYLSLIHI